MILNTILSLTIGFLNQTKTYENAPWCTVVWEDRCPFPKHSNYVAEYQTSQSHHCLPKLLIEAKELSCAAPNLSCLDAPHPVAVLIYPS